MAFGLIRVVNASAGTVLEALGLLLGGCALGVIGGLRSAGNFMVLIEEAGEQRKGRSLLIERGMLVTHVELVEAWQVERSDLDDDLEPSILGRIDVGHYAFFYMGADCFDDQTWSVPRGPTPRH